MLFIRYLRALGFAEIQDTFAGNSRYFRNSLVRANCNDLKNGIHETTEYLELFLRNLLLNENHPLHNRTLRLRETMKAPEKADIETQKSGHCRAKNEHWRFVYGEDGFSCMPITGGDWLPKGSWQIGCSAGSWPEPRKKLRAASV
jgi:hypothetical protein